jgi:hypothetical protein
MHLQTYIDVAQYPRRVRWIMAVAWLLITVKCVLLWWAIDYWHMPFHPLWIVGPTLGFAGLATGLWVTHHEE